MSGSQFVALDHVKHPQASKKLLVRPMDDSLGNKVMVNQAFGYSNQIASRALDQQVWTVRLWMQQILADGKVAIELSDGSVWQGTLHQRWRTGARMLLDFATLD